MYSNVLILMNICNSMYPPIEMQLFRESTADLPNCSTSMLPNGAFRKALVAPTYVRIYLQTVGFVGGLFNFRSIRQKASNSIPKLLMMMMPPVAYVMAFATNGQAKKCVPRGGGSPANSALPFVSELGVGSKSDYTGNSSGSGSSSSIGSSDSKIISVLVSSKFRETSNRIVVLLSLQLLVEYLSREFEGERERESERHAIAQKRRIIREGEKDIDSPCGRFELHSSAEFPVCCEL